MDIKKLYSEHPECFKDSSKFRAILLDLYPEEKKAKINVLTTMLGQGALKPAETGSKFAVVAFCRRICDDYGFKESLVKECFALFADIFNGVGSTLEIAKQIKQEEFSSDYTLLSTNYKLEFEIDGTVLRRYKGKGMYVQIPSGVTSIGNSAFFGCNSLTNIIIPDSVTSIYAGAFSYCRGLTSVTISDRVTSIGDEAFLVCRGLKSIIIPHGVTSIGKYAFSRCDNLTNFVIPDSVTSIGNEAFACCDSLKSILIPDSVGSMGYQVFDRCSNLQIIYCKAISPPTAWNKNWKGRCNAKVVWGYAEVVWEYKV